MVNGTVSNGGPPGRERAGHRSSCSRSSRRSWPRPCNRVPPRRSMALQTFELLIFASAWPASRSLVEGRRTAALGLSRPRARAARAEARRWSEDARRWNQEAQQVLEGLVPRWIDSRSMGSDARRARSRAAAAEGSASQGHSRAATHERADGQTTGARRLSKIWTQGTFGPCCIFPRGSSLAAVMYVI
jgi:hypothetical protein